MQPFSEEHRKNIGLAHKGKILSKEHREKLSIAQKKRVLEGRHHLWKGGIWNNPDYVSWVKNKRNRMIRCLDGEHTFEEWKNLKEKCYNICIGCNKKEPEIKLTKDHIIPVSKGGTDDISNIQPLCKSCNSKKNNKIIIFNEAISVRN